MAEDSENSAKISWLEFLLEGIPVAIEIAPSVKAALSDGEVTFSEIQEIGMGLARTLARRRGIELVVADRFTRNIPAAPGFYGVRNGASKTVVQLGDGDLFKIIGQPAPVAGDYFAGSEFAPVV
jgi:hypothetical protein